MSMDDDSRHYVKSVIDLYLALPETPTRVNRRDRALALELSKRGITHSTIEAALLLASARRLYRPADASPLGPIRSLHYFLPVIEEIIAHPLPNDYLSYLRHKLANCRPKESPADGPRLRP
jgi:hypothetical protein